MKTRIYALALLAATALFAASASPRVTIRFSADVDGTHTNVWFLCHVLLNNQTTAPLTVTNLFSRPPGLALKVTDWDGKELARTYSVGLHAWTWTLPPDSEKSYKLMYGVPSVSDSYQNPGISLPASAKTVKLQIEGTLSGSTY